MNKKRLLTLMGGRNKKQYYLYDKFLADLAAGNVNGTLATPSPGTRTVVDTAGTNVLIASGELSITGTGTINQAGIYYADVPIIRESGIVLSHKIKSSAAYGGWGFRANTSATLTGGDNLCLYKKPTGGYLSARKTADGASPEILTWSTSAYYRLYTVLRNSGRFVFADLLDGVGARLLWLDEWSSTTPLYFGVTNYNNVTLIDDIKIPKNKYFSVVPDVSDSFNRADGVIGTSDGAGHAEANGGSGKAWTNKTGAWTISTNKAISSTIDTVAIATADSGHTDAVLRCKILRVGDNIGVVLRYVDANNYIYAYHDGTNAALIKKVGGSDTNVVAPKAAAYADNAYMMVTADGTDFRLYYNELLVGTGTIADAALQTGTLFGMYSTNAANTIDDFVVFPRNRYTALGDI